jgi:hypothetical protein
LHRQIPKLLNDADVESLHPATVTDVSAGTVSDDLDTSTAAMLPANTSDIERIQVELPTSSVAVTTAPVSDVTASSDRSAPVAEQPRAASKSNARPGLLIRVLVFNALCISTEI